ncbi:MAG TPA: PAS domain S-box protein, partial [Candidatus Methylomirabilis sp.]|nr:PAS domain S-box protein [Candidatus Methylomirabilis sp.]
SEPPIKQRMPVLDKLRWLGVWLPVTGIAVLIALLEGLIRYLELPWQVTLASHVLMLGLIAVGAYFFSQYVFRLVRQQEDEILRKQQELSTLNRRFRALIENSSDGIVLLNADGCFVYASPSTVRLFGYTAEELLGRNGFELIYSDDLEHARERLSECFRGPTGVVRAEFRIRHKDGSWRWVEAFFKNLLADPGVQAIVSNYRDITERRKGEEALRRAHEELEARVRERTEELLRANKALQETLAERRQAEESLRESRAQLAAIIASAMEAIITIDEDQRVVVFNAAAERTFRVSAGDALGQSVQRFIPERFRRTHLEGFRDFGRTNLEKWWIGVLGGATAVRTDGEEFPIEATISQVEVGTRKLYTIILRDITERKQAEEQLRDSREQLRALAARLQSVREDERTRIAREIHDKLGQALTALKLDLAWIAPRLPVDRPALLEKARALLGLLDAAIQSVRRIATELRPGVLDDLGLVAAIEWQAQEFQSRTGITCEFSSGQADLALPPEVGTAVFRICQETLTNVARHAHATQVRIGLEADGGQLVLTVADNGRGITEQELANRTSLGLLGMRERALLLGGQVGIAGRPGGGTTVTVRIPLREAIPEQTTEGRA